MNTNFPGEILRDLNEKLLIASVQQHELAEIATQAEQRLSALVNGLNAVICEISVRTGEVLFISEQVVSFLGYDRSFWNNRSAWRRVIHPNDRAITFSYLFEAIRLRRDHEHEFRVITADGRILWIHNRAVVVPGTDDTANLLRCVIEDISARKKAEEIIAHSERRYRRLFEAARDGIVLLDTHTGVIKDVNPFVTELLGMSRDALLGKEFFEIGIFQDKQESRAAFARLQAENSVHYERLSIPLPAGTNRVVEMVGNVYRENGITVIQCNIRDVTERKRAEKLQADALHREKRITEFLQRPLRTNFQEDAFAGLSLAALYEPALAEAEVGGDFFDVFAVGESESNQQVVLCVGDVMGKGLQAAALAGRLKDVIHAFMDENPDPAHTMFRVNNYLCKSLRSDNITSPDDIFARLSLAALSLAVFDSRMGMMTISTAGAEPVTVLRADCSVEEVAISGVTLGIQRDEIYISGQIVLQPGDTLMMTTDGLTEARRGPEFLGYNGVVEIASRSVSASSISEMGQDIVRHARSFGGSLKDDVCLLLARRK